MKRYVPFTGGKLIRRYELPGYERNGWEAHEIAGRECVLVSFDQTKTNVTSSSGLPIRNLLEIMYKGEPGPGIRDTVLVGFMKSTECIVLVDAIQIDGKRVTTKEWIQRTEMLRLLHLCFDDDRLKVYPLSRAWKTGLLKAFDAIVAEGESGLLLRHFAKPDEVLCLGDK